MKLRDHALDAAAAAIADEQPLDWLPLDNELADDGAMDGLRLLDDVARAFRDAAPAPVPDSDGEPVLFRWGALVVRGKIGRGACGDVYRAFDPALQREVALKLRSASDPVSGPANIEFTEEARRLAKLRHRNVLAVYGTGINDGRAGLWTELIDGRTLAAVVAADGTLPAAEAIRIGHDLAGALAAIHGAGLIHGDVKAENVMREANGRVVLMDFGAAGSDRDVACRSVVQATPRYLPPEVRAGAPITAAVDVYAMGVLLHFVLTGRYPEPSQRLRGLRPDVDVRLVDLVDDLLAESSAERPADARVLMTRLATLATPAPATARSARLGVGLAACALLVGLGALATVLWRSPALPGWTAHASFIDADSGRVRASGTPVRLGDTLALRFTSSLPAHVYVLNEDDGGALHVLFPVPALDMSNPLPAGRELVLPGSAAGQELSWRIDSAAKTEEFVALASPVRLRVLERRLADASFAMASTGVERGAGSLSARAPLALPVRGENLRALIREAQLEAGPGERVEMWLLTAPHSDAP